MRFLSVLYFLIILHVSLFAQKGNLTIRISGAESDEGNIKVALYDDKGSSGFLKNIESAYDKKAAEIKDGKATVTFKDLPYGTYAVSVFHDLNNNGDLELAQLGFPLEPYGVSGNQKAIGPPVYDRSKFAFLSETQTVYIQLRKFTH